MEFIVVSKKKIPICDFLVFIKNSYDATHQIPYLGMTYLRSTSKIFGFPDGLADKHSRGKNTEFCPEKVNLFELFLIELFLLK
jgi:hypothetical protein